MKRGLTATPELATGDDGAYGSSTALWDVFLETCEQRLGSQDAERHRRTAQVSACQSQV